MLKPLITAIALCALITPALAHSGPDHGPHPADDQAVASSPESTAETTATSTDETSDTSGKTRRQSPGFGKEPHAPITAYKEQQMLGWKLLVHEDLIADKELHDKVMAELHHQLYLCAVSVPADKAQLLKQVPIWVELNNPYHNTAQYHPSKEWLSANGYLPEKAKCVEISSAKAFVQRWPHHKANTMLHEFAHAFHDLHLSFDNQKVIQAFKAIEDAGKYKKVQHVGGREVRHYALTDHKEYFAECTEAFFGANDHWPFVRPELKEHDPAGYAVVRELWGAKH